jgi:hypothetical protein
MPAFAEVRRDAEELGGELEREGRLPARLLDARVPGEGPRYRRDAASTRTARAAASASWYLPWSPGGAARASADSRLASRTFSAT